MRRVTLSLMLLMAVLFGASGCGGQGTTIVGNPSITNPNQLIRIGQLENGQVLIEIDVAVFGDAEDDLDGAGIDIERNGEEYLSDIAPAEYYSSLTASVSFIMSGLSEGDDLVFTITRADGSTGEYTGTVSADAESYAEYVSGDDNGGGSVAVACDQAIPDSDAESAGYAALDARDLAGAIDAYCCAIQAGSTDAEIAFGCALATTLALPESSDTASILASLGNTEAVDAFADVVDPVAIFDDDLGRDCMEGLDNFWECGREYGLLSVFFGDVLFSPDMQVTIGTDIVGELVASGTALSEFQDEITALTDDFEYVEELLQTAAGDASLSFEIPDGLFETDGDKTATATDARLLLSGTQFTIVGLDIFASYDYGINVEDIYDDDTQEVDAEILTADLNGSGETINAVTVDTDIFLTLVNSALVTAAKTRFTTALENMIQGLQNLDDGTCSEIFDGDCGDNPSELIEEISHFEDMLSSVQNGTAYTDALPSPYDDEAEFSFTANLKEFFDNPPSATNVTGTDPFIYANGEARAVEAWFEEFFDGIVEF